MARRQDIIGVAATLFAEKGFSATSVADISKAVGLSASAGGIYRHFKSKNAIFDAIFDDYFENYVTFLSSVDTNMSAAASIDKRQLARTLLEISLHQAKSSVSIIKIYLKERSRLNRQHVEQSTQLRESSVAAFKAVCTFISGSEPDFDVEAVAAILIDSINFRVSGFVPKYEIDEDRYLTSLTDLLYALVVTED